jgi:hypothetical protein
MKKETPISIAESYIPDQLRGQVVFTNVYMGKIGFVRSSIKANNKISTDKQSMEYYKSLHETFSKSPHVMEVSPALEIQQENLSKKGAVKIEPNERFLNLRVAMPERKRNELFPFSNSWSPEQFNVRYDGTIFIAYASASSAPIETNIGQVSREFITNVISNNEALELVEGIWPTPLHTDIYFLFYKPKRGVPTLLPSTRVFTTKRRHFLDLVIVTPDTKKIEEVISLLIDDIYTPSKLFYAQRFETRKYRNQVGFLRRLNQELSELLSRYFLTAPYIRLFSSVSSDIRKKLSQMHLTLQNISSIEMDIDEQTKSVLSLIEESTFYKDLYQYFEHSLDFHENLDRSAQLTVMNFAAEETGNSAIIQATLVASLIGAVIGGGLAILAQYLLK